jgi:hypothetical protein
MFLIRRILSSCQKKQHCLIRQLGRNREASFVDWHESAAKGMPPPNRDEPPSLRHDIADELGDHLSCAFACERQRTGDDEAARRVVLDRFGDPRKIARRLWLDAMWEVIMNQRILLTTCIILAAACVATATFSFLSLKQTRQANESMQKATWPSWANSKTFPSRPRPIPHGRISRSRFGAVRKTGLPWKGSMSR